MSIADHRWEESCQSRTGAKTIQWNQVGDAANIAGVDFLYDALGYRIGSSAVGDYYLDGEHLEAVYSGSQPQAKYYRCASCWKPEVKAACTPAHPPCAGASVSATAGDGQLPASMSSISFLSS